MNIEVFTQSAIKLAGNIIIYFDPYQIKEEYHDADYIFITHDHYDHFDINSIQKIIKETTKLIVPKIMEKIGREITNNILLVEPNQNYELADFKFRTYSAYNINKPYHPKDIGYVGYKINLDNTSYYIMGDTDVVPEIENVETNICFIPIGGKYTMDYQEAAEYINKIKPQIAIPIHYGSIVGDVSLKDKFKELINRDIEVNIYIK